METVVTRAGEGERYLLRTEAVFENIAPPEEQIFMARLPYTWQGRFTFQTLFKLHRIRDATNLSDLNCDTIAMLQESRRLHEQADTTWCASHDHRPGTQCLALRTESNQLLHPKAQVRGVAALSELSVHMSGNG